MRTPSCGSSADYLQRASGYPLLGYLHTGIIGLDVLSVCRGTVKQLGLLGR
ncbi:MAG: hypothetical protein JRI67_13220 [Deltaproteobacteria bacterium]|nr:hypothetical protein [Deltaproteobacteria bacterium]